MNRYYNDSIERNFFKASERREEARTNQQPLPKYPEPSTPVLTMQTELARELANHKGVK